MTSITEFHPCCFFNVVSIYIQFFMFPIYRSNHRLVKSEKSKSHSHYLNSSFSIVINSASNVCNECVVWKF